MEDEKNVLTENSGGSSNIGKIIAVILAFIIIGAVAFFLLKDSDDKTTNSTQSSTLTQTKNTNSDTSNTTQNEAQNSDLAGPPTKEQVALHNQKTDCWTIIGDKVYDITEYVPRHPGGDEILRACGTDGTSLFETRTTADGQKIKGGGSHSSTAQNQLKQFEIGSLAQ